MSMNYHSLREFVDRLENENELIRIKDRVSPILEITEITDRVSKQPGGINYYNIFKSQCGN